MFKKWIGTFSLKWFFALTALFTLVLCISIVSHLPISWLLAQPNIQKQIPDTVQLSPSHGTLWQGSTHLTMLKPTSTHLGELNWNLSFWSLLIGQASLDSIWQKEQSQLRAHIKAPLFSEAATLEARNIEGNILLPQLIELLNLSDLKEMAVEGSLTLKQIDLVMDLQTQWPSVLTGQLILNNLQVLDNDFPAITITPDLSEDKLVLNIEGQAQAWALSGKLEVFKNQQYSIDLNVTAQSESAMPDWAGMLKQESPTKAVLNHRGRW